MNGKQKRYLRGLAHSLKPLLQIGKSGLSEPFLKELEASLDRHELLKVKVLEEAPEDKKSCAAQLDGWQGIAVVQSMGKTLTLYRPHPDEPVIQLP